MNDRELDAEFERIISGWDDEASDPQATPDQAHAEAGAGQEPAASSPVPPSADPVADSTTESPADPAAPGRTDATSDPLGDSATDPAADPGSTGLTLSIAPTTPHVWRGSPTHDDDADAVLEASEPDDEHFEPPTITDLPKAEDDPMFWAIVVGLGGGPLLLVYLLIFDREGSGWWVATALAMTIVGFVLLVLRGGTERDPFDDGTRL